jgi:hypothetical protein
MGECAKSLCGSTIIPLGFQGFCVSYLLGKIIRTGGPGPAWAAEAGGGGGNDDDARDTQRLALFSRHQEGNEKIETFQTFKTTGQLVGSNAEPSVQCGQYRVGHFVNCTRPSQQQLPEANGEGIRG